MEINCVRREKTNHRNKIELVHYNSIKYNFYHSLTENKDVCSFVWLKFNAYNDKVNNLKLQTFK